MKNAVLTLLLAGLLLLGPTPSLFAAEGTLSVDDVKQQSVEMLEKGAHQQAYDLLTSTHEANRDDLELAFLRGQAAMLLNQPEEAVELYEGILAKDSNLPRVRLELGRAYAAIGERQKAKDAFRAVLADNPPPVVGENIRKFLEVIDSQKTWSVRVSAGYLYDSNVNAGPADNSVLMFGVPFQLSKDSKRSSDHGYTFSLAANHRLDFNRHFALQSDFQYSRTDYAKLHAFDSDVLSLSVGPTVRQDSFVFSLPVVAELLMIEHDRYEKAIGIAPQLMIPVTERLLVNASWTGQARSYYVNDGIRNGTIWSADAGAKYFLWENGFVQGSYRYAREDTKRDFLNNDSNAVSFAFFAGLSEGFSLYLAPSATVTEYDEREAAFDRSRKDRQYVATVNVSKDFGTTGLSAAVGYTYTRNDSNLSLYDYDRDQVTVQFSWAF